MLNSGKTLSYAYGLQIGEVRGQRIVEHGRIARRLPRALDPLPRRCARRWRVLCNASSIAADDSSVRRVADVVIGDTFTQPTAPAAASGSGGAFQTPPPAAMPAGSSARGITPAPTKVAEIDGTFTVTVDGLKLMMKRETDTEPAVMQQDAAADQFRARGPGDQVPGRDSRVRRSSH